MKLITSFFATVFLAAIALAQEESPSPAESTAPTTEEKASATVEETPAAKATEAAAPAAEKKAEPATSPKAAATTATTTKPAAPAAAAAPRGKNMSVRDMEEKWEASVPSHDLSTVQGFVASDFVGVSSQGKFVDKSSMLAEYKKDKDTYKSAKNERLNVKNLGPNVTVVTGRAREKGTTKDGKPFDRTFLFTDTWMLRGGQWQCVASQITKIKG
jgi:ketosteroid isomerase-like protein